MHVSSDVIIWHHSTRFRQELWAEVNLHSAIQEVSTSFMYVWSPSVAPNLLNVQCGELGKEGWGFTVLWTTESWVGPEDIAYLLETRAEYTIGRSKRVVSISVCWKIIGFSAQYPYSQLVEWVCFLSASFVVQQERNSVKRYKMPCQKVHKQGRIWKQR